MSNIFIILPHIEETIAIVLWGASGCGLKYHEVAHKIHDLKNSVLQTKAVNATDKVGPEEIC